MGAHLYVKGLTGAQRYAPLKKDGTLYKRISKKMAEADGARIGITTQIGNHLDTGFLFNWASKLGQQAAFDAAYEFITGVCGQTLSGWPEATLALSKSKFAVASKAAANRGTEIHDGLDERFKGSELSDDAVISTAQLEVCAWLKAQGIDPFTVKAEHCVIFEGGITCEDGRVLEIKNGATADLITKTVLADWKTVEMAANGKYYTGKPEHAAQLAFCRHAGANDDICDRDAKCYNVYISRTTGSIVHVREWTNEELDAALEFVGHCYECDKAKAKLEGLIKQ